MFNDKKDLSIQIPKYLAHAYIFACAAFAGRTIPGNYKLLKSGKGI